MRHATFICLSRSVSVKHEDPLPASTSSIRRAAEIVALSSFPGLRPRRKPCVIPSGRKWPAGPGQLQGCLVQFVHREARTPRRCAARNQVPGIGLVRIGVLPPGARPRVAAGRVPKTVMTAQRSITGQTPGSKMSRIAVAIG